MRTTVLEKATAVVTVAVLAILAVLVMGCESPLGTITPVEAHYAVGQNVLTTSVTVDSPTLVAGTAGTITAHLWVSGHPLGGKDLSLTVDGALVDTKRTSKLGTVKLTVPGLAAGLHTFVVSFDGQKGYAASEAVQSFQVQ